MDKLKTAYDVFYSISKKYLEQETGTATSELDFDSDVNTLMTLIPVLEKKVCELSNSITDEQLILMMKYCNYQVFSFWFLKSGAVVKSVYNKISDDEKSIFLATFKDVLLSSQTLISLNHMYSNIRRETADIVSDSKKIMEIISQVKSASGEGSAYNILQNSYSFIVKTINKILSDKNYLLKLVSVFDPSLINDRNRLDQYRELLVISTESAIHGIKCVSKINVGLNFEGNKYSTFFKKVLSNVILFQNQELNSQQFVNTVSKLYLVIYQQLVSNPKLANLLNGVIDSVKTHVSIDEIKQQNIRNIQGLIKFIANNKVGYKDIVSNIYLERENIVIEILQEIVKENNIEYENSLLDIKSLIQNARTNFFSKF